MAGHISETLEQPARGVVFQNLEHEQADCNPSSIVWTR